MNFRTKVDIPTSDNKIDYSNKILFLGSCFADAIGEKLKEKKFHSIINPFGVLYNPASIADALKIIINKKIFTVDNLHFANERWFSFHHHSDFSHTDKKQCLETINKNIEQSHLFLKKASHLFITLGTAWVFRRNENGKIVSNCHKLPAKEFTRERLSVDEAATKLQEALTLLRKLNPEVMVCFTVSPIRHWKDTAHGNQLSKATLLLAIDKLRSQQEQIGYFPSYEIVMDELRDYRFYASDMIHISPVAVDYIFERFSHAYFSEKTIQQSKEVEKVVRAMQHRAFNPHSEAYTKFCAANLKAIQRILQDLPSTDFSLELDHFSKELKKYS